MICRKKNLENLRLKGLSILFLLILIKALGGFTQIVQASSVPPSETRSSMTIQGHVTNEVGIPIEGVVLSVKWGDQQSSSDLNGMFKIFNVNEGDTITVKHNNYQPLDFVIEKSKMNYFISLKNAKNVISSVGPVYQKSELIDIQGKVQNEIGNKIPNAVLIVTGTNHGTATDSNGQFKLLQIPVNGKLSISHIGYSAQETNIEKHKSNYEISLKKVVNVLEEMVVVSYNSNNILKQGSDPDSSTTDNAKKELIMVEQNPEFPGGNKALYRYFAQNIHYPIEAAKAGIQGRIFVLFTINEDGNIRNPRIDQGLGSGIDEEALRIVLNMPRWIPAKQMEQTVSADYKMPINFQLESASPKPLEKK